MDILHIEHHTFADTDYFHNQKDKGAFAKPHRAQMVATTLRLLPALQERRNHKQYYVRCIQALNGRLPGNHVASCMVDAMAGL